MTETENSTDVSCVATVEAVLVPVPSCDDTPTCLVYELALTTVSEYVLFHVARWNAADIPLPLIASLVSFCPAVASPLAVIMADTRPFLPSIPPRAEAAARVVDVTYGSVPVIAVPAETV